MRLYFYFQSDGVDWWSDERRTYDGKVAADWLFYRGVAFKTPRGIAFAGDFDAMNEASDPYRGELHMRNLRLTVFK